MMHEALRVAVILALSGVAGAAFTLIVLWCGWAPVRATEAQWKGWRDE